MEIGEEVEHGRCCWEELLNGLSSPGSWLSKSLEVLE